MKFTIVLAISLIAFGRDTPSAQQPVRNGVWGGNGIEMTVTTRRATIDYGCDSGTIDGKLRTDSKGRLHARGTHVFGQGGPRTAGGPAAKLREARYEGVRRGDRLDLTVLLPELNRNLGKFSLRFGQRAMLERCG